MYTLQSLQATELKNKNWEEIPECSGIYKILVPDNMQIQFSNQQHGRHVGNANLYSADKLEKKYAMCKDGDKKILYIGKAGGEKGLRQRLRQYINYGVGKSENHKGGRAIWQVRDCWKLLVCYEPCENPSEREHELLIEYKKRNGCYPLANWKS